MILTRRKRWEDTMRAMNEREEEEADKDKNQVGNDFQNWNSKSPICLHFCFFTISISSFFQF